MSLEFKNLNLKEFQKFVEKFPKEKTFLQTENFGTFRQKIGEKIFYYAVFDRGILQGVSLIQKIKTKLKTFLHCPHGPLLLNPKYLAFFLENYKNLGKLENCDFVRINSLLNENFREIFREQNFFDAPIHMVNPEQTWILNLENTEDEILANMKKSTRYEVRRIEKSHIKVQIGNEKKDLDIFWKLHTETFKRQKFIPFPRKNTETERQVFDKDLQIFSAKIDDEFHSSSIILFDSKSAYYHQGASVYSKLPVAHATIWEAIKFAKNRGCKEFNFWGVIDDDKNKHPWFGLSKFKKGFGGDSRKYLHCQDFALTKKYWLNYLVEKYRKWRRGY